MELKRIENQQEFLDGLMNTKKLKATRMIEDFMKSSDTIAEITLGDDDYKTPASCRNALNDRIQAMGLKRSVKVSVRDGKIYMISLSRLNQK